MKYFINPVGRMILLFLIIEEKITGVINITTNGQYIYIYENWYIIFRSFEISYILIKLNYYKNIYTDFCRELSFLNVVIHM